MLRFIEICNPPGIICSDGMTVVADVAQEFLDNTWRDAKPLQTLLVLLEIDRLNPPGLEQTFVAEENSSVGTFHVDFQGVNLRVR
jgi:hypothetical protein